MVRTISCHGGRCCADDVTKVEALTEQVNNVNDDPVCDCCRMDVNQNNERNVMLARHKSVDTGQISYLSDGVCRCVRTGWRGIGRGIGTNPYDSTQYQHRRSSSHSPVPLPGIPRALKEHVRELVGDMLER